MHIQGLYAEMVRDDISARVRQLTHAVLRRALKQALKWGMIQRNPCDAVDPPRVPKREIAPLDAAQVQKLLKAAKKDRLYTLYVLAIATGLRQGELFALRLCDVDLNRKVVSVRFTLVETATERFLAEPKSARSRRQVDLTSVRRRCPGRSPKANADGAARGQRVGLLRHVRRSAPSK